MSDNRSSSGVRNLRAMFENNGNDSTSPPSRGRSPAGSENSGSARPLSKVRANFVAVERNGQNGTQIGLRKASDVSEGQTLDKLKESSALEGAGDATEKAGEIKPEHAEKAAKGKATEQDPEGGPVVGELKNVDGVAPSENGAKLEDKTNAKASGPVASGGGGEGAPDVSSTKEVKGKGVEDQTGGLGGILKGSAFEKSPPSNTETVESKPASTVKTASSRSKQKPASAGAKAHGKVRESAVAKKTTAPSSKAPAPRPSKISTTTKDTSVTKPATKTSPSKPSVKSPSVPRTPHTPITPSVQSAKTASPKKTPAPKEDAKAAHKEASKTATKQPSRASLTSTSTSTAANISKPRQAPFSPKTADTTKKSPTQTSPFTKAKPKSPTRPVRLSASATAPTASSAAKTGSAAPAAPPSRSPSRQETNATTSSGLNKQPSILRKDRPSIKPPGPTTTSTLRNKSSRPSLASQPGGQERTKSRTSTVGSKAPPDEGFLARMMKPTASSASKVHEKVEVKNPPRKSGIGAKGKRKSVGKAGEDHEAEGVGEGEGAKKDEKVQGVDAEEGKQGASVASAADGNEGEADVSMGAKDEGKAKGVQVEAS